MHNRISLTARLTALYIFISAIVLIGLAVLVSISVSKHFVEMDRAYLKDKTDLVEEIINSSTSIQNLNARLDALLVSHHGLFIELRDAGRLIYGAEKSVFPPVDSTVESIDDIVDWSAENQPLRGLKVQISISSYLKGQITNYNQLQLQIALNTIHHSHFLHSLQWTLIIYLVCALLISGLLGCWAASRGLEPLRNMKDRALAVTAQSLDQRMPAEAVPVEFADLAQSLNNMLERLQADFNRLQDFSSDLAHELRTPINNLLIQTQVSLTRARDASEYRDILASNAEEFQRLARMVSDMLFLAKTEHGIELPNKELVSLRSEVYDLFDFYEALAQEKNLRLVIEGDVDIFCDRLMVRRAISNLLSNAVRYSSSGSLVSVVVTQSNQKAQLCVKNTGSAIAPNDLTRLFDRFYRGEKSRNNPDIEGTGLGLSITKAILEAHGGSVSVQSSMQDISFVLNFPK